MYMEIRNKIIQLIENSPKLETCPKGHKMEQNGHLYYCTECSKTYNILQYNKEASNTSLIEQIDENKNIIYQIMYDAKQWYIHNRNKQDLNEYYKRRGITNKTLETFELGYSENTWNNLTDHLLNKYELDDILKSGLVKQSNGKYYDTFRGRIMFPIYNEENKVIGFGANKLYKDDPIQSKYINSKDSEIYHKKYEIYGLNLSSEYIEQENNVYIVEGYFDLITLFMNGIRNVVATSGTALSPEQISCLNKYTQNITLVFDSDQAGKNATIRAIPMIMKQDMDVEVLELPEGEDPDSYVLRYGPTEFQNLKRIPVIQFLKNNKIDAKEYIDKVPDENRRKSYYIEL